MNPMLQEALGAIIRWLLTGAATWFVSHHIWTADDATRYVAGATVALLTLGWTLYRRYLDRRKLVTALAAPAGLTEQDLEVHIARAKAIGATASLPSVSTPKDQAPLDASR